MVDALGHRVIPGLNDSHIHLIRGGVNYLLELRWDGVPTLSLGLRMAALAVPAGPTHAQEPRPLARPRVR